MTSASSVPAALRFWLGLARAALLQRAERDLHPARTQIHAQRSLGEWAADGVASFAGSWPFVGLHVAWFALWLLLHLDINLLTLIVSLEAIFLATFVLMSQNRGAAKDRTRDDVEAQEVDELAQVNRQQLTILQQQSVILDVLLNGKPQPLQTPPDALSEPTAPLEPSKAPNARPLVRRLPVRRRSAS